MGFEWARPTTFDDPMFDVGDRVHYYGVDHTPSYLWDSATWDISEAVMPFLRPVLEGAASWQGDETLSRAIEIQDGRIRNPDILEFQGRSAEHPYLAR
jgi:alanine dehydrogenase